MSMNPRIIGKIAEQIEEEVGRVHEECMTEYTETHGHDNVYRNFIQSWAKQDSWDIVAKRYSMSTMELREFISQH